MNVADLIRRLAAAGVELTAEGDNIRVRGANRKPFIDELRERKQEVLDHLRRIAAGEVEPSREPEPIAADPAEFQNWINTPETLGTPRATASRKMRGRQHNSRPSIRNTKL